MEIQKRKGKQVGRLTVMEQIDQKQLFCFNGHVYLRHNFNIRFIRIFDLCIEDGSAAGFFNLRTGLAGAVPNKFQTYKLIKQTLICTKRLSIRLPASL